MRPLLLVCRSAARLVGYLCMGLGAVALLAGGAGLFVLDRATRDPDLPEAIGAITLRLELTRKPAADPPPPAFLSLLTGQETPPTLLQMVQAIDAAAQDARVARLHARIGPGCCASLADVQELRAAILRFRATGKPTAVHAETLGESRPATAAYYLASAFARITLSPPGAVGLTGIRLEVPFYGEALRQFGVAAQFGRRGDYKAAPETYTADGPSAAHRANLETLADDLFAQLVDDIAQARGLSPEAVRAAVDAAPLTAAEAGQAGLVDALEHESPAHWRDAAFPIAPAAYLRALAQRSPPQSASAAPARVALVQAAGQIGEPDAGAPRPGTIAPRQLAATLAAAIDDPANAAILLRIDSPGGSVAGSALIGAEVERARARGKPLVVSMGSHAASGGYWIASHAAAIVAQPASLTGSIGVYAGKLSFAELMDRLRVSWVGVQRGARAGMNSAFSAFDEADMARLAASLDATYDAFLRRVAEGRRMDPAAVRAAAEGRIWTGRDALAAGLVDRLGGLREAEAAIRSLLALAPDHAITLVPAGGDDLATALRQLAGVPGLPQFGIDGGGAAAMLASALADITRLVDRGALEMAPLAIR